MYRLPVLSRLHRAQRWFRLSSFQQKIRQKRYIEWERTTLWKKKYSTLKRHAHTVSKSRYTTETDRSRRVKVHDNSARMAIWMQTKAETFSSNTLCIRRKSCKKPKTKWKKEHSHTAYKRIAFNARDKNACVLFSKKKRTNRLLPHVLLTVFVVFDFIAIISVHSHFVAALDWTAATTTIK